jgi:hypothetical protein
MKLLSLTAFLVLVTFAVTGFLSTLHAGPQFWTSEQGTPTPPDAPNVNTEKVPSAYLTASPTPVVAPAIRAVAPTPTPRPGLKPIDPTAAALMSVVVPGSGEVYAGDPLKGLAVAALFGVGLWQTLDKLSLVPDPNNVGQLMSKDENLGELLGLATLVVYGYQIQDASDTAVRYNKTNYLTFNMGISPKPNVRLAYMF